MTFGCKSDPTQSPVDGSVSETPGQLGSACYPNQTCNEGLDCVAGRCVWKPDGGVDASDGQIVVPPNACQEGEDSDGDWISDLEELCVFMPDFDKDGTPDFLDKDSDGDGLSDALEAGDQLLTTPAKDSDKDGFPDYLDRDSDNDGLTDGQEDRNGDGRLGCCRQTCGETIAGCPAVTSDRCGHGQVCQAGSCTPPIALLCSDGETDPTTKDTFGLGTDKLIDVALCDPDDPSYPGGATAPTLKTSAAGDWTVAVPPNASYAPYTLSKASAKETAAAIDHGAPTKVAGFVISRPTTYERIQEELLPVLKRITQQFAVSGETVSLVTTGSQGRTHDKYLSVQNTLLKVTLPQAGPITMVRNRLVAALLDREIATLGQLPADFGSHTSFIVRFTMIKRVAFAKDASGQLVLDPQGNPVDSGDKDHWRMLVIGAVAGMDPYLDTNQPTGIAVDDLSNGSALAADGSTIIIECDAVQTERVPAADIIWVVDESGSMDDDRQNIIQHAQMFFSRALSSGLDFRMGITGVNAPDGSFPATVGKFCSQVSASMEDDGGVDRFLLPSERAIFEACISNPPGAEYSEEYGLTNAEAAIKRHLPRKDGSPYYIRPEAQLVVIVVTDEIPLELEGTLDYDDYSLCSLNPAKQQLVNSVIQPYLTFFSGLVDPESTAQFMFIGGGCTNTCQADVGHGYIELTQQLGGMMGDVCQTDIWPILQEMVDRIAGAGSPFTLEHQPISSTLTLSLEGSRLYRSRDKGFDYRAANNALLFINTSVPKGSVALASYQRWQDQ